MEGIEKMIDFEYDNDFYRVSQKDLEYEGNVEEE